MITDPIANTLCMINNAIRRKHKEVSFYSSKMIIAILEIMRKEGYIIDYIQKKTPNNIAYVTVFLKYNGDSAIRGIKRVSKPGHRIYCKAKDLMTIMNGMGTAILSTNQGIICEKTSKKLNIGGEVLHYI
ncbi:30S ribosomal protein S8-like [Rattus rattus]|uniref:30S ribosomal protein S8-like n=1 Tax=Rattus rattus TaxID=10117 RepID=UPI0013F32258|nr:30S ribosomal protein S8-like [Rattus rattus]